MMTHDWLSLSEVAVVLGVHPSTVRSWADKGRLPVHRTQGGHRRFRRQDVELWVQSQRADNPAEVGLVIQNALGRARLHIGEGHLESQDWYRKIDAEGREKYRQGGRALLQGLTAYLASDDEAARAQAHAIGYQYAVWGRRLGLTGPEATRAFLFFRRVLVDSMLEVYEAAAVRSPQAWGDMFRKISGFTDAVLASLMQTYEAYQRGENNSHPKTGPNLTEPA
jgi:excisionase family DNA binding protein